MTWPYTMTTPYWSDFVSNSTFHRILSGFHRTFATGLACRQGTLTPPDTWSRPFGLAYVLLVETNPFPNLSLFYRTMLFEYPSVFSRFYLKTTGNVVNQRRKKNKIKSKIEKVPRGIRGEKSSTDMASSRNLVSTIWALASPKMGDGTRCPEG